MFDLDNGKRYRITAFWGDDLAWYPSKGLYLAFMMWGIEGKHSTGMSDSLPWPSGCG